MNEKELKLARNKYNELMKQNQEETKEKENKIKVLKEDSKVNEYIELSYDVSEEGQKSSKNRILEKSFGEIAKETEKNDNIYVFVGYYGLSSQNYLVPLSEKNPHARYLYFVNLETTDIVAIQKEKTEYFFSSNVVLYLDDPKKYHHVSFYREKFNDLRNKYFSYLVEDTQKEAIKQIIKKR